MMATEYTDGPGAVMPLIGQFIQGPPQSQAVWPPIVRVLSCMSGSQNKIGPQITAYLGEGLAQPRGASNR
jgi:hypothetical protein